ncbi:alpha/beta fold hydrolase BchO [Jannaschia ovalis]|uniref:Alpha/beta fold hydrolase n=1 Tax=Jannaschia ovalis TaxID=3038773 RepID=A0ABY8LG35_9RHOB|nr:alpha/beta fold hydrolase BchO [Jannaschia sp. GRR-S6-38]WGH80243.1 alpha/beta fold hydrolase [Jannaschia sp. GRR-S6-38]
MIPPDWPFADASRFVESRPHRWHVQQIGAGPDLLLLHGAGGATHSWRGLAPLLAKDHRVTMIDLPGHGFTRLGRSGRSGLDPMAEDVTRLMERLDVTPAALIGHSAGAAVALRMALDAPRPVIAINGAFQEFEGLAGWLFPIMAKALALNPLTPIFFTAAGSPARTRRLLEGTGSRIDADGLALYHRLVSDRDHVGGALAMMANWSLERLIRRAPDLTAPVLLLTGAEDRAVDPKVSRAMADRLPGAELRQIAGHGHLLHETAPAEVAEAVGEFLGRAGVAPTG